MTPFGMLLLALGVVSLLWAIQERRFYRRAMEEAAAPWEGPAERLASWERRMALARRNEIFNWVVAVSMTAILAGFVSVGLTYHASLSAVRPDPPEVTVPRQPSAGPGEETVLRWQARYPGGQVWAAVADGGYVLFRAARGHFDQYLLYGPAGNLIWQGERAASGPAPRAAVAHRDGRALLAVEEPDASARLMVFTPDGVMTADSLLPRFPADTDPEFHAIKSSAGTITERWTSPDRHWRVVVNRAWFVGVQTRIQVFGPAPAP